MTVDLSLLLEAVYQESGATIFVLNNGRLGMVTEKQEAEFGDVLTPKRCPVDYDALGDAIDGLQSFAVSGTGSLGSTVRDAVSYDGTAVVEVPIEQRLSPDLFDLERLPRVR